MIPLATYRLQFHEGFRFADAARLAPYLARLGISHVYASPYLKARPGSTHGDDINYRRFFDINDLAGLRMALPELFDHTHVLALRLIEQGTLDGLRIDHIDGLLDPKGYLERLRHQAARPFYLVVEKILAHHESLREDWPVEGTTGYDFTNLALALLVDPAAEDGLTRANVEFTGERRSFAEIVRTSKIGIMENEMASELNVLARDGARAARQNPHSEDFTQNILQRAIKEVVACFPVYRTDLDGSAAPAAGLLVRLQREQQTIVPRRCSKRLCCFRHPFPALT